MRQKCLKEYCFVKKDIVQIASMIGWPSVSARNGQKCDPLTANCFFLQHNAWKRNNKSLPLILVRFFWEMVEKFVNAFGYKIEVKSNRLRQRAARYEKKKNYITSSPLLRCVSFIDCTKTYNLTTAWRQHNAEISVFWTQNVPLSDILNNYNI